jgi:hypothetical protein
VGTGCWCPLMARICGGWGRSGVGSGADREGALLGLPAWHACGDTSPGVTQ